MVKAPRAGAIPSILSITSARWSVNEKTPQSPAGLWGACGQRGSDNLLSLGELGSPAGSLEAVLLLPLALQTLDMTAFSASLV